MHLHRYEKIWLMFGMAMLVLFLAVLGAGTFALGMEPPDGHHIPVDPEKVAETPPFDNPGLHHVGGNIYNAYMIAHVFGYKPQNMEIPLGATVHFQVTSVDVVHGFQIVGTNVNLMAIPGAVSHYTHTFDEPGEYLLLCNEYCGAGHEYMATRILVK
jgi:cytochrome c oxidase subunit 2